MSMTLRQRADFLHRTRDIYDAHRACARTADKFVFYRLEDLRCVVEPYLQRGECAYCRGVLCVENFVISHKVPPTRGGKYTLRNLCVGCRECTVLKGALDEHEFRDLLRLLEQWPRPLQNHFRRQLRAGATLVRTALPVCGSLPWFTGKEISDEVASDSVVSATAETEDVS